MFFITFDVCGPGRCALLRGIFKEAVCLAVWWAWAGRMLSLSQTVSVPTGRLKIRRPHACPLR